MAKSRKKYKKVGFLHQRTDSSGHIYLEGVTIDNHTILIFPNRQKKLATDPDFLVMMPDDEADILFASNAAQSGDPFDADEVTPMGQPSTTYEDAAKRVAERAAETRRRQAEEAYRTAGKKWSFDPSTFAGFPGIPGWERPKPRPSAPPPPPRPPPRPEPNYNRAPPHTPTPPPQDKWTGLPTAFRVLEVDSPFDVNAIRAARAKLVLKHHPDHGGKQEDFMKIQDAYKQCMAYRGVQLK